MKRIYWRPQKVSRNALLGIACCALAALALVEYLPTHAQQGGYDTRIAAAHLAARAFAAIRDERLQRGLPIDPELDPCHSGLIGDAASPVTSVPGHLDAKRASINPNFAAVIVELLWAAGVKEGDVVAVGCSGSFPALNAATFAALETLQVRPVVISSASASQYGANLPEFVWLDMERVLYDQDLISFQSVASSLGGVEDTGARMSEEAVAMLKDSIARNGVALLEVESFQDAINKRMRLYGAEAAGAPIKAYINIGGGTVSVGKEAGKHEYTEGLSFTAPLDALAIDSVMTRFIKAGTPVIHMINVRRMARGYGFPLWPTEIPPVGQGNVFVRPEYNRYLAAVLFGLLLVLLRAYVLTGLGYRLSQLFTFGRGSAPTAPTAVSGAPELMV